MSEMDEKKNLEPTEETRSPGEILRGARERLSMSVEYVADELRLTNDAVRRLESDDYEGFKARVFVLGYLTSYARLVGENQDTVSKRFAATYAEPKTTERIVLDKDDSALVYEFLHRHLSKLLVGALLVVLVGVVAIVWYFWTKESPALGVNSPVEQIAAPQEDEIDQEQAFVLEPFGDRIVEASTDMESADEMRDVPEDEEVDQPKQSDPVDESEDISETENIAESENSAESDAIAVAETDADSADIAESDSPPEDQTEGDSVAAVESSPALNPDADPVQIELRFSGESWVEVNGAGQGETYARLGLPDETVLVMMTPPVSMTVGNASECEVIVDGHAVDLEEHSASNVARFVVR